MKSECASRNCGYFWKDEDEAYPRCHFEGPFNAPCEEDDDEGPTAEELEDWYDDGTDEMGFDPYEGGYTWDC